MIQWCTNRLWSLEMLSLRQEQLFEEIDILPKELKTQIIDKLLNSINPKDKSVDDLWIKEVNRRKNDIEEGKIQLMNGDNVFKKISQRLKENKTLFCLFNLIYQ